MVEVYRRTGSPYYYFDLQVGGKRTRRSTKRTKKAEAQAVAMAEAKTALDRVQLDGPREITIREALFDHYLPLKVRDASYVHLKRYAEYLCGDRPGVAGLGGDTPFHELTTARLNQYRAARMADGMSDQSIDHEIKCLSAAYNVVKEGYRVPPRLTFPMVRRQGTPRYLTQDEEAALIEELDPTCIRVRGGGRTQMDPLATVAKQRQDNYDIAVCLLDLGCRYGEAARLTWSMVDTVEFSWVDVFRSKVNNEGRLMTTTRLREVLRRRWKQRGNSHYVFPSWDRGQVNADAPRVSTAAIRRAMRWIGINSPENVRRFGRRDVRSLRDTFATKLVMNGVDLARVQKLLGHSTPAMTQKYAHLSPNVASQQAVSILDQINGGTNQRPGVQAGHPQG